MKTILQNRHVVSALTTFTTVFLVTLGLQVNEAGTVVWTSAFWFSVLLSASRAGIKAVVEIATGRI